MEYVYAAMLLHAAEKDISEDAVAAILKAVGVDVDDARVKALVASLGGIDIAEAMTQKLLRHLPLLLLHLLLPQLLKHLLKKKKRKKKRTTAASRVLVPYSVETDSSAAERIGSDLLNLCCTA